ncbi:hypothetical protein AN958_12122, partial [Leucoagaricus sp. SymC.cos]
SKMESFIRSKYESRRWATDGPPPTDPSVLESGSASEPPPPLQEQPAPTPKQSHASKNSVSSRTGYTTQQPQAHQLLSANFSKPTPTQPPAQSALTQSAQPIQPSGPQNNLLSLDFFSPPPVTPSDVAPQQPRKDVKQDILSLYPAPAINAPSANPLNQFGSSIWNNTPSQPQQPVQPTSMIGSAGVGAWGTSSGWNAAPAPPAQPNLWGGPTITNDIATQQASLFNTSDVWGSSATSNTGFTPTAPQKKDDAFSDIWGSFK